MDTGVRQGECVQTHRTHPLIVFIVYAGDDVKTYYDPMIAKLVVWNEDRNSSLKKLSESLKHYQVRQTLCVCMSE